MSATVPLPGQMHIQRTSGVRLKGSQNQKRSPGPQVRVAVQASARQTQGPVPAHDASFNFQAFNEPNSVGNLFTLHYFGNVLASFFRQLPCTKQSHELVKSQEVVCTCRETGRSVQCTVEMSPVAALCGPGSGHPPCSCPSTREQPPPLLPLARMPLGLVAPSNLTTHQASGTQVFLGTVGREPNGTVRPPD